jgi:hypothetical protein
VDHEGRQPLLLELQAHQVVTLTSYHRIVLAQLRAHAPQPERSLHAHHELGGPHGFGQEVIAAGAERAIEGVDVAQRR